MQGFVSPFYVEIGKQIYDSALAWLLKANLILFHARNETTWKITESEIYARFWEVISNLYLRYFHAYEAV